MGKPSSGDQSSSNQASRWWLAGLAACLGALLVAYSQTAGFAWDEGYHMLAEQLITGGKRPYLDFCFPQAPLNAYWNAAWMRLVGSNWHAVHGLAAVETAATILLAADFVRGRVPMARWQLPAAAATALLMGVNAEVLEYGTTGQPYAFCLFLLVAAFRVAVAAAEEAGWGLTAITGLLASASAASSLLTVGAPTVLLWWLAAGDRKRQLARRILAFGGGAVVPWLPVVWLAALGPRQVLFNLFQYHLFYRRANWEDATQHDWQVLASGLRSPAPVLLGMLAAAGIWTIARRSAWKRSRRTDYGLCGWLAGVIGCELAAAHPTFEWYFVLIVPFLAMPAAAGLAVSGSRLEARVAPWMVVAAVFLAMAAACARSLYEDRHTMRWSALEAVARKVEAVTPPGGGLWADEQIYFLTRRAPAEGTELPYAEVIDVPAELGRLLHIVALDELDRRAAAGVFQTVSTCEEAEQYEALNLPRLFRRSAQVGTCHVFWEPVGGALR